MSLSHGAVTGEVIVDGIVPVSEVDIETFDLDGRFRQCGVRVNVDDKGDIFVRGLLDCDVFFLIEVFDDDVIVFLRSGRLILLLVGLDVLRRFVIRERGHGEDQRDDHGQSGQDRGNGSFHAFFSFLHSLHTLLREGSLPPSIVRVQMTLVK